MNRPQFELIVCGGGPAGICAAIAAARAGVRPLLIERYGFLGGMATAGLVNPIYGFGYYSNAKQIIRGLPEQIVQELSRVEGGTLGHRRRSECAGCAGVDECPTRGISSLLSFDPEAFKYVSIKMLEEAAVELLLHSLVCSAVVENDAVTGVVVENKSGRQILTAKLVIDCTGDGDIAASAGNPYAYGRRGDQAVQPTSVVLRLGGVERTEDRIPPEQVYVPAADRTKLPALFLFRLPRKGEYIVNHDSGLFDVDPLKAEDLTRVHVKALKEAEAILQTLRIYGRGCERAYLISTAEQVGIRESRRIAGQYTLTEKDVVQAKKFADGVARVAFPIDIHNPTGRPNEVNPLIGPKCGDYYEIPYRSLVPNRIGNLLVAGRCISGTHEAHGSYRVMAPCMAMGQAAGCAAALCITNKCAPKDLDTSLLRDKLRNAGVWI
jgi:glycine/D-amino acid oxidase-like deaminating enzyme